MPENKFPRIDLVSAVIIFFVCLFLYAKFGPSIPFTVNQTTTNKAEAFTVSAEGKVIAKPDTAEISLGVQTQGSSVKIAQDEANKAINNVTVAIKKLGIAEKDIKTTNYSVYPEETNLTPELPVISDIKVPITFPVPRKITRYHVNTNLTVTVRDLDKINDVIDAGTANGANQIGGINFTVDKIDQFRSQARKIAIDNAKIKASEIAKEAGINLVKIINVSEGYNNYYAMPMMAKTEMGGGGGDSSTRVEAGTSEISVTVTLIYETR